MNNDDPRAAAQLVAVTATLRALMKSMATTDPQRRGEIEIAAGNTINQVCPEGTPEHRAALEQLRFNIFGG